MPINEKKVFKFAKGFRGRAKNCRVIARARVEKALQVCELVFFFEFVRFTFLCTQKMYVSRKLNKRIWRQTWITEISAGVRQFGITYSRFISGLEPANVKINRKMLAELAKNEPYSFASLVSYVQNFSISSPQYPKQRGVIPPLPVYELMP